MLEAVFGAGFGVLLTFILSNRNRLEETVTQLKLEHTSTTKALSLGFDHIVEQLAAIQATIRADASSSKRIMASLARRVANTERHIIEMKYSVKPTPLVCEDLLQQHVTAPITEADDEFELAAAEAEVPPTSSIFPADN